MSTISMTRTIDALDTYKSLGYKLIDVPQCVDFDVSQNTKPEGIPELFHRGMKVYVGSAEQSFIQLHKEGRLGAGKYMAVTPCFRHEGCLDDTHYRMFLKLELIVVGEGVSRSVAEDAKMFMDKYLFTKVVSTQEGVDTFDIESHKGVELGSYGVRKMLDGTLYTYGTGLAEPRMSIVLDTEQGKLKEEFGE